MNVRRLALSGLISLCALTGVLFASSAPAFAATMPETPVALPATPIAARSATLNGVLNPGAKGEAGTYEFVYRQSTSEECTGGGEQTASGIALGEKEESVSAPVSGLLAHTTYAVCLLARNSEGEASPTGPAITFTTHTAAPTVSEESVSNVGSGSARLSAQIDSEGEATSYQFEYSTDEVSWATAPELAGSLGAGSEAVGVLANLEGLQPETAYHFRVTATNHTGAVPGGVMSFKTFPVGLLGLPDDRGYEMVTPPVNEDSTVYEPRLYGGWNADGGYGDATELPFQAATNGNSVAYVGTPSSGGNGSTGRQAGNEYLAKRLEGGGWTTQNIQPVGFSSPAYQAFSSDLSTGILDSQNVLSEGTPPGGYDDLYSTTTTAGSYEPLFTVTPPNRTAYEFGASGVPATPLRPGVRYPVAYAGASSNMTHVLFEADDALTSAAVADPPNAEQNDLYDSVDGQPSLVNVLPDGSPAPDATFGGLRAGTDTSDNPPDFSHVISDDGSRIFWTALESPEQKVELPKALYVRENDATTVQVDAAEPGAPGPSGGGRFWTASSDGSKVFFTDENRLTNNSTAAPGAPDLYEFDTETRRLTDLSEDRDAGHADVQGVVGSSEDGSYVYFVAGGALASGAKPYKCTENAGAENEHENEAEETANGYGCNLYVIHEEEPAKLITTLSVHDNYMTTSSPTYGDWQPALGHREAEVTPDGRQLAFISVRPLTGYDNVFKGPVENPREREIFVYNTESGKISCASCNPTGLPPATEETAAVPLSWSNTYMQRFISDEGSRVFFDSDEALVPQATDGQVGVYEWEEDGSGTCRDSSGCIYLLSGGTSTDGSFFLDASENADDVFIITRAQLVPQDQNEVFDVYDARIGAVEPISPPACTGSGCQGVPAAPPIFATPPSVTFSGVGNFPPPAPVAVKPKPKSKSAKCKRGYAKKDDKCAKKKARKSTDRKRSK